MLRKRDRFVNRYICTHVCHQIYLSSIYLPTYLPAYTQVCIFRKEPPGRSVETSSNQLQRRAILVRVRALKAFKLQKLRKDRRLLAHRVLLPEGMTYDVKNHQGSLSESRAVPSECGRSCRPALVFSICLLAGAQQGYFIPGRSNSGLCCKLCTQVQQLPQSHSKCAEKVINVFVHLVFLGEKSRLEREVSEIFI